MLLNDFYTSMFKYSISELRVNKDYQLLCKCLAKGINNLAEVSNYLLNMCDIDQSEGIWLDYLGWLVGTSRRYFNIAKFFSANSNDINATKYFWFANQTIGQTADLSDVLFRRRIYAKIGYNTSKGTRADIIYILKNMTFADKVIIETPSALMLDITLEGDNIIATNQLLDDITDILPPQVGIRNLSLPANFI